MKNMLSSMKKRNSGVPEDILPVFEGIVQKYAARGAWFNLFQFGKKSTRSMK